MSRSGSAAGGPAGPPREVSILIRACRSGDDAAKAEFYNRFSGFLRAAIEHTLHRFGTGAETFAEDILHDIFLKIWADDCRLLAQLKRPGSINAWLATLARNRTIDHLRQRGTRRRYEQAAVAEAPVEYPSAVQGLLEGERRAVLEAALNDMAPPDRLILTLYYVDRLRYCDIATVLSLNINTVAARIHRARQRLLREMKEDS